MIVIRCCPDCGMDNFSISSDTTCEFYRCTKCGLNFSFPLTPVFNSFKIKDMDWPIIGEIVGVFCKTYKVVSLSIPSVTNRGWPTLLISDELNKHVYCSIAYGDDGMIVTIP